MSVYLVSDRVQATPLVDPYAPASARTVYWFKDDGAQLDKDPILDISTCAGGCPFDFQIFINSLIPPGVPFPNPIPKLRGAEFAIEWDSNEWIPNSFNTGLVGCTGGNGSITLDGLTSTGLNKGVLSVLGCDIQLAQGIGARQEQLLGSINGTLVKPGKAPHDGKLDFSLFLNSIKITDPANPNDKTKSKSIPNSVVGNPKLPIFGQKQQVEFQCGRASIPSKPFSGSSFIASINNFINSVLIPSAYAADGDCTLVPEPSSNLGILAVGAAGLLSATSTLKRKAKTSKSNKF